MLFIFPILKLSTKVIVTASKSFQILISKAIRIMR